MWVLPDCEIIENGSSIEFMYSAYRGRKWSSLGEHEQAMIRRYAPEFLRIWKGDV